MTTWAGFAARTAVIVLCGTRLSRHGDILAEPWGLGRNRRPLAWDSLGILALCGARAAALYAARNW